MNTIIQIIAGLVLIGAPAWLAVVYFGGSARDRQMRERYRDPL